MTDEIEPALASAMQDAGGSPLAGEESRTESGIPLGRIPSRGGLLTWNGTDVEELPRYPVDSRWVAWANRGTEGGWWMAYHEYARGEHLFRANGGPWPRVMIEEWLRERGDRAPDATLTNMTPPPPPDPDAVAKAEIDALLGEPPSDAVQNAEVDDTEAQDTKPTTDPTRWD